MNIKFRSEFFTDSNDNDKKYLYAIDCHMTRNGIEQYTSCEDLNKLIYTILHDEFSYITTVSEFDLLNCSNINLNLKVDNNSNRLNGLILSADICSIKRKFYLDIKIPKFTTSEEELIYHKNCSVDTIDYFAYTDTELSYIIKELYKYLDDIKIALASGYSASINGVEYGIPLNTIMISDHQFYMYPEFNVLYDLISESNKEIYDLILSLNYDKKVVDISFKLNYINYNKELQTRVDFFWLFHITDQVEQLLKEIGNMSSSNILQNKFKQIEI